MPALEDGFLTVERKVIAILPDNDCGDESGCGHAAFLQARWQRGDDGHDIHPGPGNIFGSHEATTQEPSGFVVELLADFLSDPPPCTRIGHDFFGLEDLFDEGRSSGQRSLALRRFS